MNPTIIYCLIVAGIGVGISIGIFIVGKRIFDQYRCKQTEENCVDVARKLLNDPNSFSNSASRYINEIHSEYLHKRNEYWIMFGQIIIAVLVATILTILLLTKTISAEAGLPIISGVSGFAIAKGVTVTKTNNVSGEKNL